MRWHTVVRLGLIYPPNTSIELETNDIVDAVRETLRLFHLLYVAWTRARDWLVITGVKPTSEFLDNFSQEGRAKWSNTV